MNKQWLKTGFAVLAGWMVVTAAGAQQGMNPRFVLKAGGAEVYDKETDRTWQRCSYGTRWKGAQGCVGVILEVDLPTARTLETGGWRLPSKEELATLVTPGKYFGDVNFRISSERKITEFTDKVQLDITNKVIDPVAFPSISHRFYLTNGRVNANDVWCVSIWRGGGANTEQNSPNPVLLVRTGE